MRICVQYLRRQEKKGQPKASRRAEQIFCENDYQQTSIEKIADACGLVKGTVLYYFGSKENCTRRPCYFI